MIAQILDAAIILLLVLLVVLPVAMATAKTLRQYMARRRLVQTQRSVSARPDAPGAR